MTSNRSTGTPRRAGSGGESVMWVWIGGLCAATLASTYMVFVEPPPPRRIVIASGGRSGAYYGFAKAYAESLRNDGVAVEVRETAGSVENLELLGRDGSGVDLAIVQSGVAAPEQAGRFLSLGSIYREPMWLFHRREKRLDRVAQLEGLRIGVGPAGSGTQAVALRMLAANDLGGSAAHRALLSMADSPASASALQRGELDAAFFVAAFGTDYVQRLLADENLGLLSFDQQEAYRRRFRYLSPVTLPAGVVDLGRSIPPRDVSLLAPTAMLVVRKDFHPAFVPLLLAAAGRIHGAGDEISEPGEFPSGSYCDFPLSEDARRFYRSGQPVLQRLLPFWIASLADRAKVMLIPLVMLAMPLMRAAPPLIRWRTRRKIYRWYSDLREIDRRRVSASGSPDFEHELMRLSDIERQVADLDLPLSYMEEFYQLRLHLGMLQQQLLAMREVRR